MPRNPNKTPCSVPGCRAWALRGSDPPTCSPHRHTTARLEPAASQADPGQPRVGAPPGNQNRLVHGFYASALHPQEQADLVACAADTTLDAEIAITRVALRRILGMLLTGRTPGPEGTPLTAWDYARFAGLAFQGAGAVSRLLRARQSLTGGLGGALGSALDRALHELGEEWGVDL
jgi:hypothetical protein